MSWVVLEVFTGGVVGSIGSIYWRCRGWYWKYLLEVSWVVLEVFTEGVVGSIGSIYWGCRG